jgi:predicted DNA binding CopG/RHH family protein
MLRFDWDERRRRCEPMKREYDSSKLKEVKNPYAGKKKAVGINLSPEVLDYFKELAEETKLPYQKLIDLYLMECAKKRKRLDMKWVASPAAASAGRGK